MTAVRAAFYAFVLSIPVETIFYFRIDEDKQSGISLSRIVGVVLFGLALVNRRHCFRRFPPAFWLVSAYLAAYALSQLWIPADLDARFREQQLTLLQMAALFLLSYNLFEDVKFREGLLRVFGWGVGLSAAAMVAGVAEAQFAGETRSTIISQNPNITAGLFALGALCIAGDPGVLASRRRSAAIALSLAAVSVLVMGILRTGSRGGLLAFGGGVLGLALCGGRGTRLARLVVAGAVAAMLGVLISQEFRTGSSTSVRLERAWNEGDTTGRTGIYNAAWAMFQERPLLGHGGAQNRFVLGTMLNKSGREGRGADRDTHSVFLAVLTEVGLVGALPFFAALLLGLWQAWRWGRRTGDALPFALMCALLIINSATTGYREKTFWIVLAVAAAAGARRAAPAPAGGRTA